MRVMHILAIAVFATGCSVGSFTGKVGGLSFTPKDAIFASAKYSADANSNLPTMTIGMIAMSSGTDACADFNRRIVRQKGSALLISLVSVGSTSLEPPTGTYTADPNAYFETFNEPGTHNFASAFFSATDENCNMLPSLTDGQAASADGTVKLTASSTDAANGDFSLTFGSGDKVTGTFSAQSCAPFYDELGRIAAQMGYPNSADPNATSPAFTCKP